MLKKLVLKFLNKFNFYHTGQVRKADYKNFLDGLLYFLKNNLDRKINIVQVGSNDGVHSDPLNQFVSDNQDNAILLAIEPQLEIFEKLKKNYQHQKNVLYFNGVIGDGSIKNFFSLNQNFQEYTKEKTDGVSSLIKENLTKRLKKKGIKDYKKYINCFEVKTYLLDDIIKNYNLKSVDVLQIDAEGYDDEIIYNSSLEKYQYKVINYEFKNLTEEKLTKLHLYLKKNRYEIIRWNKSDEAAVEKII